MTTKTANTNIGRPRRYTLHHSTRCVPVSMRLWSLSLMLLLLLVFALGSVPGSVSSNRNGDDDNHYDDVGGGDGTILLSLGKRNNVHCRSSISSSSNDDRDSNSNKTDNNKAAIDCVYIRLSLQSGAATILVGGTLEGGDGMRRPNNKISNTISNNNDNSRQQISDREGRNHQRTTEEKQQKQQQGQGQYGNDDKNNVTTVPSTATPWFHLVGGMDVVGWGGGGSKSTNTDTMARNYNPTSVTVRGDDIHPKFGRFTNVTFRWTFVVGETDDNDHGNDNQDVGWEGVDGGPNPTDPTSDALHSILTSVLVFEEYEMIIFDQYFETGWTNPNTTTKRADADGQRGSDSDGSRTNDDDNKPIIVAGFPTVNLTSVDPSLGYLLWGGCFLADTRSGIWGDVSKDDSIEYGKLFNGDNHGQPWVLFDPSSSSSSSSSSGRTMVWSSMDNFLVSGFAATSTTTAASSSGAYLEMGLRTTLESILPQFHHTSVLFTGSGGINSTLMDWGDVLLRNGGVEKGRSNVYDDFTLSHLGYWTDNGAYFYNAAAAPQHSNMEEALLATKAGMADRDIPIRYVQWDDWWMETVGDVPGILSWTPKRDVFPSGFSDWLGMPLAMYAPEYSKDNVWIDDYEWMIRGETSIPTDPSFYMDLFANGTRIGMKMFEQDFLCSYGIGRTGLTNSDVSSGKQWLANMDAAAQIFGIKLQLCMPDSYHLLHSTTLRSVTNARATGDNTRKWSSIHSMGQNSLLYYALGVFASRDNVWTSRADVNQTGCGNVDFCFEPNAAMDNAAAVLSCGPYGIADAVEFTNKTIVMYSCRIDGLLLRPRWPLASLDFTFTDNDGRGFEVWAAHDDFGYFRWSYILGIGLKGDVIITPDRLLQGSIPNGGFDDTMTPTMVAWEVVIGAPISNVVRFSNSHPLMLPKSKPLNLPYDVSASPHTHYNAAPVLPNGMVLLGETDKWATMSMGRVKALTANRDSVTVEIVGAPNEVVTMTYIKDEKELGQIREVKCVFESPCSGRDQHGNTQCSAQLHCERDTGCQCFVLYKHLRPRAPNVTSAIV